MSDPLRPEVITSKIQRRARRRNVALASTAAAIGGAVGTSAVVFAVLPLMNRAPSASASVFRDDPITLSHAAPIPMLEAPRPVVRPLELPVQKPAVGRAAFVLHADAPRFVLSAEIKDEWLVKGAPTMAWEDNSTYVLERDVDPRAVPATFTSLVGRSAALFDDEGNQCRALVGSLSAMLTVVEDFQEKPDTASERADAWGYGEPSLVARLHSIEGSCEGTLTAAVIVDAETEPDDIERAAILVLETGDDLVAAVNKAFAATPEYGAIQTAFVKQGGKGDWRGSQEPQPVTLIGDEDHGIAFVSVSVGSCGDFEGTLTAAYEVRDNALGSRIAIPGDVGVELVAAADTNGDGVPELFVKRWFWTTELWTSSASGFTVTPGAEVVAHICPC